MYSKSLKGLFTGVCLSLTSVSMANNIKSVNSCVIGTTEPQYQVSFKLPKVTSSNTQLVLRLYQPWGDGSSTGWQQSLNPPLVTLDGQQLEVIPAFSYTNQNSFQTGALSLGTDEYAQYFVVPIPETSTIGESLVVTGGFQQVAYMSATVYNYGGTDDGIKWQLEKFDYGFTTLNNGCNPYQTSNPSVFAYSTSSANTTLVKQATTRLLNKTQLITLPQVAKTNTKTNTNSGAVGVYRLDQYTSRNAMADDIAADGCSQSYLFAKKSSESQEVLVMRIKVPTTFINDDTPDTTFGDYQVRYFSISANVDPKLHSSNPLGYWTVNARMLEQYADKDGYAYVFFAPNDYTNSIATQQGTSATQPPVITWGKYQGYLLGDPDFAIIMRYKAPSSTWVGSPANAVCYRLPQQLQALSNDELGSYTPEIYADTFEDFNNGNIGAVNMNNDWPTAQ